MRTGHQMCNYCSMYRKTNGHSAPSYLLGGVKYDNVTGKIVSAGSISSRYHSSNHYSPDAKRDVIPGIQIPMVDRTSELAVFILKLTTFLLPHRLSMF